MRFVLAKKKNFVGTYKKKIMSTWIYIKILCEYILRPILRIRLGPTKTKDQPWKFLLGYPYVLVYGLYPNLWSNARHICAIREFHDRGKLSWFYTQRTLFHTEEMNYISSIKMIFISYREVGMQIPLYCRNENLQNSNSLYNSKIYPVACPFGGFLEFFMP